MANLKDFMRIPQLNFKERNLYYFNQVSIILGNLREYMLTFSNFVFQMSFDVLFLFFNILILFT